MIVEEHRHLFKTEEDQIQKLVATALKELKNEIQNEGAIPVFKIVLASDAMISHI